ncbi:MAG: hypothetical protein HQK61_05490 [Desulfamplus sp.]|nr:hypothetical protein [Desulfamplus sp.]
MTSLWPEDKYRPNLQSSEKSWRIKNEISRICKENRLPHGFSSIVEDAYLPLASWVAQRSKDKESTMILGINGAQGSGKSTLCRFLEFLLFELWQIQAITVSIDDLYKTRHQREYMAKSVHPLFQTRGVPGTHDVGLGLKLFNDLKNIKKTGTDSNPVYIPRFNKALDDRYPESEWTVCTQAPDVILFEGWCVAARHQSDKALSIPVNRLEREKDQESIWRGYVNLQLEKKYPDLFDQIDHLVMP